jgi:tol-pal system protein YbgF
MKIFIAALLALGVAAPAAAQNKREMQMMADIRMLQEQNQQLQVDLQAAVAALNETLKMINGRVDEQASAARKAFADQTLKIDQLASEQRVVREGVSESNVRISQLSQEVEAVRLSIPQFPPPAMPAVDPAADPSATPGIPPAAPAAPPPAPVGPGMSPQKLFDTARADYYGGLWDSCINGFEAYLRTFPGSPVAHEAQYLIGECNFMSGKHQEAVAAYNQVITTHPRTSSAPLAYFKRGKAFEELGQIDRARESYEAVMKTAPDSDAARLAKQSFDRLVSRKPK